jgi:RNA-binding protein
MTSKERSELKAKGQTADTIIIVGKSGVSGEIIKSAGDAISARELIKGKTLETCPVSALVAAAEIATAIGAEVVQVIGGKFVLFRENPDKDKKSPKKPGKKPPVKPKKVYLKEKKMMTKTYKKTGIKKPFTKPAKAGVRKSAAKSVSKTGGTVK